jgi:hypothetical protein
MKSLIFIILFITLISSCTKNSGGSSSPRRLDSIETQLVGTWYLQSKSDSSTVASFTDTSYTAYTSVDYITFKNYRDAHATPKDTNYLDCNDAIGASSTGIIETGFHPNFPIKTTYWWYEDISGKLYIAKTPYYIVGLTSTDLMLKTNGSSPYSVVHLHK